MCKRVAKEIKFLTHVLTDEMISCERVPSLHVTVPNHRKLKGWFNVCIFLCLRVLVCEDRTHPCSFSSSWSHSRNLPSTRIQNLLVCWYTCPVHIGPERCGTRRCLQERKCSETQHGRTSLYNCINIHTCWENHLERSLCLIFRFLEMFNSVTKWFNTEVRNR